MSNDNSVPLSSLEFEAELTKLRNEFEQLKDFLGALSKEGRNTLSLHRRLDNLIDTSAKNSTDIGQIQSLIHQLVDIVEQHSNRIDTLITSVTELQDDLNDKCSSNPTIQKNFTKVREDKKSIEPKQSDSKPKRKYRKRV